MLAFFPSPSSSEINLLIDPIQDCGRLHGWVHSRRRLLTVSIRPVGAAVNHPPATTKVLQGLCGRGPPTVGPVMKPGAVG